MISEEGKEREVAGGDPYPPQYGTFQGVASYPPQPVIGFPQPVPPPGATAPPPPPQYYAPGYQAVPGLNSLSLSLYLRNYDSG